MMKPVPPKSPPHIPAEVLSRLMQSGPTVVYTVDVQTMAATSVSGNVRRELGYTAEEFLAPPGLWRSILHPEDAPGVFASFGRLFKEGELSLEYRLKRKDGQWRWTRDELVLRCDGEGQAVEIIGCARDIEDQKRAEQSKVREGALFEAMFRNHQAVMLLLHPQSLEILDANEAAVAFYGWSREELTAMNFRSICQDGPACHLEMIEKCRGDGCREAVRRHRCASGIIRVVDIRASRITVEDRAVLFAIVSDITGRVTAEEALRQSESRLRSLYENTSEGMFQSTEGGRFLWANPSLARILGYGSVEELMEQVRDIGEQVYHDQRDRRAMIRAIREQGAVERWNIRGKRSDGSAVWLSISSWAVKDEAGTILRMEGVVEDVTARKRAESERMLLATAVEQAVEGVAIITGGTWRVEYVNPAFTRVTGLDRQGFGGRSFFEFFGQGRRPMPSRDISRALAEGREWAGPVKDLKPSGEALSVEVVFSPLRDETGKVTNAVVLMRDVGHLDRLEKRLRRAQKLEAVGTLAGGIAHDFNNILTPILLNAEVGMQLLSEGDILRRPLEEIIQAGGRARQLVRQILAFSRQGELRTSKVELEAIVSETMRSIRAVLPHHVEVRFEKASEDVSVMADPSILHQIISNLTDNALHAMQERGGMLTVRLDRRELAQGETFEGLPAGEYAVLTVADTGHGMEQGLMDRIFTPFFTTKNPGEGTGMGLSTVYGAARSLGGGVRVESELGKGSLFEVYLPLAGPGPSSAGGGRRALVVDAQAFSRRALAMSLGEFNFKATMMRDPAKALRAFKGAPGAFDVVLCGEDLSGMSGRDFLRVCREIRPEARLVLLSERAEAGTALGVADAVLQRPASASDLAQALLGPRPSNGAAN